MYVSVANAISFAPIAASGKCLVGQSSEFVLCVDHCRIFSRVYGRSNLARIEVSWISLIKDEPLVERQENIGAPRRDSDQIRAKSKRGIDGINAPNGLGLQLTQLIGLESPVWRPTSMGKFDGVARADWLLKLLWVKQVYTALTVAHNEPLVRQKNRAARRLVAQRVHGRADDQ